MLRGLLRVRVCEVLFLSWVRNGRACFCCIFCCDNPGNEYAVMVDMGLFDRPYGLYMAGFEQLGSWSRLRSNNLQTQ